MSILKNKKVKKRIVIASIIVLTFILVNAIRVMALSDDENDLIISIIGNNQDLFNKSSLLEDIIRLLGMLLLKGLAVIASACANLYDKSFGLIDFTQWQPVKEFLEEWRVVWAALVCASIGLLGLMFAFFWDKRPKVLINILLGILVVTSMTWMLGKMNTLISKGVRDEIMGTSGYSAAIYESLGSCIHDLLYIDNLIGLTHLNEKNDEGMEYKDVTYSAFDENQMKALDINEKVYPDDVRDESSLLMEYSLRQFYIQDSAGNMLPYYSIEEIYDGVAWTSFLSEYYYRYKIDWGMAILQMLSLILIYLFFAYKVVRTIYEIVWHEFLAILYSANMAGGQKILKIFDSIKDCYLILLFSTVSIKMYLLAVSYISGKNLDGITKAFFLLFIAFAVIDGPHIVQKLTGQDAGLSDGLQKIMSTMYGTSAAMNVLRMGAGAVGAAGRLGNWAKNHMSAGDKAGAAKEALNQQAKEAASGGNPEGNNNSGMDAGAEFNNENEQNTDNQNNSQNESSNEQNSSSENSSNADTEQSAANAGNFGDNQNFGDNSEAFSGMDSMGETARADALNGMDPLGNGNSSNGTNDMDRALDNGDMNNFSRSANGNTPIDTTSGMFNRDGNLANPRMSDNPEMGRTSNAAGSSNTTGNERSSRSSGNRIIDNIRREQSSFTNTDNSNRSSNNNERSSNFGQVTGKDK